MDNNVLLEGLGLFEHLVKRGNQLPHQIIRNMIKHKQDVSGVKVYLECMLDDINNKREEN